jgi:hypothetical protein
MGIIRMVFKLNARTSSLDEHRTITVCSLLNKLYSTCLAKRLSDRGENNENRADTQTGFREYHQTSDNVLVLRSCDGAMATHTAPLFAAFLDERKAYDSVLRQKL